MTEHYRCWYCSDDSTFYFTQGTVLTIGVRNVAEPDALDVTAFRLGHETTFAFETANKDDEISFKRLDDGRIEFRLKTFSTDICISEMAEFWKPVFQDMVESLATAKAKARKNKE